MSAYELLNLSNELRKRDEMPGLPNILCFFCNEFNKLNKTGEGMLDSISHEVIITLKSFFWRENVKDSVISCVC